MNREIGVDEQSLNEIKELRAIFDELGKRVEKLEEMAARQGGVKLTDRQADLSSIPLAPIQKTKESVIQAKSAGTQSIPLPETHVVTAHIDALPTVSNESSETGSSAKAGLSYLQKATAPESPGNTSRETTEVWVGRHLNKVGISLVVIGCALGIIYEFQYFNAWMKILCGLAIGSALLGLGYWFERRTNLKWYGRGVTGGGWGLLYFTVYAAHHFDSVRVLDNLVLDLLLLLTISAGAVWHSLRYKSETITGVSLTLGLITTCLSSISYFTLASSVLLIACLGYLVTKMRWLRLFLYGEIFFYGVFLMRVMPQIDLNQAYMPSDGNLTFWLRAAFLTVYWAAFNVMLFSFKMESSQTRYLATASLINGLAFVPTMLTLMEPNFSSLRFFFLILIGGIYACMAKVIENMRPLANLHIVLSLFFTTLALSFKVTGDNLTLVYLFEIPLLVWAGCKFSQKTIRGFAFVLSIIVGLKLLFEELWVEKSISVLGYIVPSTLSIGLFAALCFGAASCLYGYKKWKDPNATASNSMCRYYFVWTAIATVAVTSAHAGENWLPLLYAAECSIPIFIGLKIKDTFLRVFGTIGVFGTMIVILPSSHWDAIVISIVVALMYGLSCLYRRIKRQKPDKLSFFEHHISTCYDLVGTIVLTLLLADKVNTNWLVFAWAAEGMCLLWAGFKLNDKPLRVSGLAVLGLILLKLLFVDLASAETIYRIISFIAAGIVLLIVSYAYARFTAKPTADRTGESQ